jgi:hypothetical protein
VEWLLYVDVSVDELTKERVKKTGENERENEREGEGGVVAFERERIHARIQPVDICT